MLELRNIRIAIGQNHLFSAKEILLQRGVVALIGRNGSGKSTLIRTLLGEHPDADGSFRWNGQDLKELSPAAKAQLISVVYSRPQIFGNHTVFDVLALGRLPHQGVFSTLTRLDKAVIQRIADLLKIGAWFSKSFQVLSDGEKQLVMIGRALVQDTPIILMDEPAAFLDVVNRYELSVLLKQIADETEKLIICSTHQLDRLEKDCDQVLLIDQGELRLLTDQKAFLNTIHASFGIS